MFKNKAIWLKFLYFRFHNNHSYLTKRISGTIRAIQFGFEDIAPFPEIVDVVFFDQPILAALKGAPARVGPELLLHSARWAS